MNDGREDGRKKMGIIVEALFQIHGLANLLAAASIGDGLQSVSTDVSSPLTTISEVITEKAETCLKLLEAV